MEQATVISDTIPIISTWTLGGDLGFNTDCIDYEQWTQLPVAVKYNGNTYVKTGWNSDTGLACYKVSNNFAVGVK